MKRNCLNLVVIICAVSISCGQVHPRPSEANNQDTSLQARQSLIIEKERLSSQPRTNLPGKLINTITFDVQEEHTKDFEGGIKHWLSLESPGEDLAGLAGALEVVITDTICTVVIDYPLDTKLSYVFLSPTGFTRKLIVQRISQLYHRIYQEEEATATIKTIPIAERTDLENRNATDGVYKIWGHDLADLVLSGINIYRTPEGELVLLLDIES